MSDKIDAIIVDPDAENRARLRSAMGYVNDFGNIHQSFSFSQAISRLESEVPRIVVFISSDFTLEELVKFIEQAKQMPQTADSAYIVVMRSKDQSRTAVAQGMLGGVDGVLLEPYSVDSLLEITRLAAVVYRQRKHAREEALVEFIVKDTLKQLDAIAYARAHKKAPGDATRAFRSGAEAIKGLSPELFPAYLAALNSHCESAKPTRIVDPAAEERALQRIKDRMDASGLDSQALGPSAQQQRSQQVRIIKKR